MLLSDKQIRELCTGDKKCNGRYLLDPFSEGVSSGGVISFGLTSAGFDLRLADDVLIFKNVRGETIDAKRMKDSEYQNRCFERVVGADSIIIPANGYVLGMSLEYISLPRHIKGTCVGKSTYARCGILVNTTPLEPGWHGHLTIEIANISPCPVKVYCKEGIAQLEFELIDGEVEKSYGDKVEGGAGKYQGQTGVTPPKVI